MGTEVPRTLSALLEADSAAKDAAWEAFLHEHSKLILQAAHSVASGPDDAMDRYAFILDHLRADDYRRLRQFTAEGRSKLSTWLIFVSRRLCIDYHRERYGRRRESVSNEERIARRNLADLVGQEIDITTLRDQGNPRPDDEVRQHELQDALEAVLQTLPARDRLLLRLRFEDGVAVTAIAELMGFPSQFHVYRKLKSILVDLRQRLEQRGVRDPNP